MMKSCFQWNNSSVFASYCKLLWFIYLKLLLKFDIFISYGDVIDTFPLPEVDLAPFLAALDKESAAKATSGVPPVWSPVEQKVRNWIDSKYVMKKYGKGGKCVIA